MGELSPSFCLEEVILKVTGTLLELGNIKLEAVKWALKASPDPELQAITGYIR